MSACPRLPKRRPFGTLLVLAVLMFVEAAALAASEPFGHVSEIAGIWFANGKPLELWSPIPEAAEIRVESPASSDQLRILRYGRDDIVTIDCVKKEACARAIKITNAREQKDSTAGEFFATAGKTIVSAVADQFKQFPKRYSHHLARGGELADAVVQRRNGTTALEPVFRNVTMGRYLLRVQPIESEDAAATAQRPLTTYEWDPRSPAEVEVGSSKSPLQELLLFQKRGGSFFPTGQSAWILICQPDRYPAVTNTFGEAISLTEKWGDRVDPTAKVNFLRAYLSHLSATCQ